MTTISSNSNGIPLAAAEARGPRIQAQGSDIAAPRPAQNQAVPRQAPQATLEKAQTSEAFKKVVDAVQQRLSAAAPDLSFSVDSASGETVIKVTDPATNDVIRQIPSEEVLKLNQEIRRMQGLLFSKKA